MIKQVVPVDISPEKPVKDTEEYDFMSCGSSPLQMGSKLLRYTTQGGAAGVGESLLFGSLGGNLINLKLCLAPDEDGDD